jgi:hypothetical protein
MIALNEQLILSAKKMACWGVHLLEEWDENDSHLFPGHVPGWL